MSLLTACAGPGLAAAAGPAAQPSAATVAPGPITATGLNGTDTLPVPVNTLANGDATTTILNPGVVSWVHFGDLHITTADQQNYIDLQTIIAQTNQYLKTGVNFAVLPGDNANDDTEAEYQSLLQGISFQDGVQSWRNPNL